MNILNSPEAGGQWENQEYLLSDNSVYISFCKIKFPSGGLWQQWK